MDHETLKLLQAPAPVGNYMRGIGRGGIYFLSGQLPLKNGKILFPGRVGEDRSIEEGQAAARQAALNVVAQIRHLLGSLSRLDTLIRVDGLVACAPDFYDHAAVLDGASDLFREVLENRGFHARSAAGVVSLPRGATVELVVSFAPRDA
jgi:enamine deaminase RidA (YjgF/YER057c/UK114 family)